MKYVLNLDNMRKETFYNTIHRTDYSDAKDYLEGLTIVSEDYKEVFKRYKDVLGVVFLVDPPYLSTEVGTYKMYWHLADYLNVLHVLKEHSFVYLHPINLPFLNYAVGLGIIPQSVILLRIV